MNPGRYFIPNYSYNIPMKNPGLFSRIFSGFRGVNWTSLLTNANKTLNVVNQTIPLIRQTGPMFNNLRSMIQLTRAFNSETVTKKINKVNTPQHQFTTTQISPTQNHSVTNYPSESPNFFI